MGLFGRAGAYACGSVSEDNVARQRQALVAPTNIDEFVILSSGVITIRDGVEIESGHVGTTFWGIPDAIQVGNDSRVSFTHLLMGNKVRLGERTAAGGILTGSLSASSSAIYQAVGPYSAPPPLPTIHPFSTIGPAPIDVASGDTLVLAGGSYTEISVQGTLVLSGGTYELNELTFGHEARLHVTGESKVRVAGKVQTGDRAVLVPMGGLGAEALRLIVGSSASVAVRFGHDNEFRGLLLAPNGGVIFGDRFKGSGAFVTGGDTEGAWMAHGALSRGSDHLGSVAA